ncbi:MAG: cobyrinate a,c-diamide synthase [Lachnospiraceae bacterium]|nr:cobyrinate a,c-diamide synthase [Lachnospiraceae bacterium]
MISAVKSGSGKTTLTLALLSLLKKRGMKVCAFKCGPDYIDPLFHKQVLGIPSSNIDPFFQDRDLMRCIFAESSMDSEISVIEGVMGYYDGLSFDSAGRSSHECAVNLDCPVILCIDARGMSYSVIGVIKGMRELTGDSHIQGVILNNIPEQVFVKMKPVIEKETDVRVFGFLPHIKEAEIGSRHLGLLAPEEISDIEKRIRKLSDAAEETLDIEGIIRLSGEGSGFGYDGSYMDTLFGDGGIKDNEGIKIGIASDEAFSFIYEDNLDFLRRSGAEPVFFSPLRDSGLPEGIDGCIFCGGYPEVYAGELSGNHSMLESVRNALSSGLPALAECGGYLYLHESIRDTKGKMYRMAGLLEGARAENTGRLNNFGYKYIKALSGNPFVNPGDCLKAHEFHYYDSTDTADAMEIVKVSDPERRHMGMRVINNTLCGFPHFYYYANPSLIRNFLDLCRSRRK